MHQVQLKNQRCEVFYEKLTFIYLKLPKFKKTIEELETHFDKWLFVLKHLSNLQDRPQALQEEIFSRLFEVAEIANFSAEEEDAYENSLKYYRDIKNVVDTSRQEGIAEGLAQGLELGQAEGLKKGQEVERQASLQRQRSLLLRQLTRKFGELPETVKAQVNELGLKAVENLGEQLFAFESVENLLAALDS